MRSIRSVDRNERAYCIFRTQSVRDCASQGIKAERGMSFVHKCLPLRYTSSDSYLKSHLSLENSYAHVLRPKIEGFYTKRSEISLVSNGANVFYTIRLRLALIIIFLIPLSHGVEQNLRKVRKSGIVTTDTLQKILSICRLTPFFMERVSSMRLKL